ncbi:CBM9 family sugar-binding protein [Flagellimonas sp. HMM57]|uniref:CBM9 family sugar-binding protein n=1 Tax=unclassified Flagellimonas TaxID=2644544 RepID=UPI0013D0CEA3|nr:MULTISPECIES: CBM9 family sugar-binding protein [unclassified Flagellimonas]UII75219.1 CBM9 family sugar-binding protein [Flagellimonas sp. HMM57]
MQKYLSLALFLVIVGCSSHQKEDHQTIIVNRAQKSPIIDGQALDACWGNAKWLALDQLWLGDSYTNDDFSGRYKVSWDEDALYLLVEITDDILFDQHKDPLKLWWDDDCVEIFVDEDNSGGEHQFSHNAFAYHVALDGNVVDLAPDEKPKLYNEHVTSKHITDDKTTTWEIAVKLFSDDFKDGKENKPISLSKNKKVGFALAYCDNDNSKERENFIGSVFVPGEDKNQGWINADVFGTLILK